MSSKIIKITDTTLRDAHQSLFATRFNNDTISELAPLLDNAGYDVLEVWGEQLLIVVLDILMKTLGID